MGNGAEEFITEDRARVIVMQEIGRYEREVGSRRHEQNTRKLDRLTWIAGIGFGVVGTLQCLLAAGVFHR
jgi:hypothetical protein